MQSLLVHDESKDGLQPNATVSETNSGVKRPPHTGKPWAPHSARALPQNNSYRPLLERRRTQRLSSQSLLDMRVSRGFGSGHFARFELLLDVLNTLNDTAEEEIGLFGPNLGQPTRFVDPRRAMVGVRLNLGR